MLSIAVPVEASTAIFRCARTRFRIQPRSSWFRVRRAKSNAIRTSHSAIRSISSSSRGRLWRVAPEIAGSVTTKSSTTCQPREAAYSRQRAIWFSGDVSA
jgi:hypothetical protein